MANKTSGSDRRSKDQLKKLIEDELRQGATFVQACEIAGRSVSWLKLQRNADPEWSHLLDRIIVHVRESGGRVSQVPDFPEFCEKYLGMKLWPHQLNMFDVLQGRPPRWQPDGVVYEPGTMGASRVLINLPPNHCAVESTPVVTANRGWVTVGEVTEDDFLLSPHGEMVPVVESYSTGERVPVFAVEFGNGERVVTDSGHKWVVDSARSDARVVTTGWLAQNPKDHHCPWRVRVADPVDLPEVDLPIDPYVLGYWLGDGDSNGYRIACSVEDAPHLEANLELAGYKFRTTPQLGGVSVYVYGMTTALRELGLLRNKHIPEVMWRGSFKQRLALLQGLMDSDGTITVKDSRARFVQVDQALAQDVFALVASVGLKPHFKTYRGRQVNPRGQRYEAVVNEVGFRTGADPVFRLERKAARQKPIADSHAIARHHTIRSVTPAGEDVVRCLSVVDDSRQYLIGRSMIPTVNAKTMSISIGYVLWRMLQDPTLTVLLISKTQGFASKILWAIKNRLTAPKYADLQLAFGPAGGFKESADRWTQTQVYLWGAERDGQDKDPSVEAVGMGGQIYGSRARLVLIDDAIVLSNAAQWENQQDWIRQEVASRIGPEDQLVVVGTRVAPVDLYRELRNPDHYADGEVPWTYLGMPAVLEYADDPKDWKTLWPKSDLPFADADVPDEDGNFPRWTGERIARVRNEVGPKRWGLVYMQHSVNEVSVFDPVCVLGSQDGRRSAGMALTPGVAGGPDAGALLSTVIGVDPAVSGYSAFCVYTFDRRSGRRWVIEVKVGRAMTPAQMRQTLEGLADTYKPIEIVIEANAFQSYMIKDQLLVQSMASRGVVIKPHYTHSRNKMDPTAGVASLAPLFGSTSMLEHQKQHNKDNLISLPAKTSTGIKVLVEELIAWDPELETRKRKQDCLMALWVAETRARDLIVGDNGRRPFQPKSGFLSERDQAKRFTVRLSDLAQAQGGGRYL